MRFRKIGFWAGEMNLRGTHIAIYDYALHNQEILGNQSVIFCDALAQHHDPTVMEKFARSFELCSYQGFGDVRRAAEAARIDAMYVIKSGEINDHLVPGIPNLVHAVFPQPVSQRHGEVYAFVSEWLSKEYSNYRTPWVPHMITLPTVKADLREQLGLPADATVLGCYGGSDSFNIGFVHATIQRALARRPDLYFLFMNIDAFAQHERIRYLPGRADMTHKVMFINTCDAMIHARAKGESFGIACGEFSISNKPVITYAPSPQRSHLDILGEKAIRYWGPRDLQRILLDFDRRWSARQEWDCYSGQFSPLPVMNRFRDVFLTGPADAASTRVSFFDRCAVQGYRARRKARSHARKLPLWLPTPR